LQNHRGILNIYHIQAIISAKTLQNINH